MPKLGDTTRGHSIGRKDYVLYIWSACVDCGKERWVRSYKSIIVSQRCVKCSNILNGGLGLGNKNPRWCGGKPLHSSGYVLIRLYPDDAFFSMGGTRPYVFEHRLIMAKHLGRCLRKEELIHHKNGVKTDNNLENLELTTRKEHYKNHQKSYQEGYEKGYQEGIKTQKEKQNGNRINKKNKDC